MLRKSWIATTAKMSMILLCVFLGALKMWTQQPLDHHATAATNSIVLQGEVHGAQNHSYVEVPFDVPSGTRRVTLTFDYTGKDQRTTLDLGLADPTELRCWSGGNKKLLTVGLSDATPSCLPGPIPTGKWKVVIGVPNIRPQVTAHYTLHIDFSHTGLVADEPAVLNVPLRSGPAWYRGDLHMHTGHSDGQCPSQTGKMVACPVFATVNAAAQRELDFIAITDHNATSQYNAMRELQPYFDKLLLIPGREVTTFYGHINFLGTTDFVDFRLGSKAVPDADTLLRSARQLGALTSINHPRDYTGEACMGCGWTPPQPVDMHLLTAIEAVNSGSEDPDTSGIPFWETQLNLGFRLTAIGGSDNHRPMKPLDQIGSVGNPTTVVYASDLSTPAILAGIAAGHVCIDLTGSHDRMVELEARAGDQTAHMGDSLKVANDATVELDVHAVDVATGIVVLTVDGKAVPLSSDVSIVDKDQTKKLSWKSDGKRHWIRVDVMGPEGKLWLLGNPVYINY
ncbi:CehA/McbA family metallohydrolase [Granulicella sp. S156]|uniref:CehA/McbA family metallohydrolase n=1 Tax=Granulicella sp. S156 TaxID=1747224 RepID=UPI001C2091A7|nr:CehA/McbA family metallohydrolase [Granulicella sp. S156]